GGGAFCVGRDRGKGRLVYLSVPHGLSITKQAIPVLPRLIAHLSRGLMPIEVAGEVQWLVNRTDRGWAVTLPNAAGPRKPQQGVTTAGYQQNPKGAFAARRAGTTAAE